MLLSARKIKSNNLTISEQVQFNFEGKCTIICKDYVIFK